MIVSIILMICGLFLIWLGISGKFHSYDYFGLVGWKGFCLKLLLNIAAYIIGYLLGTFFSPPCN